MLYWDLIMMALIMVIVFLLPCEAAFVPSYSSLTFGEMREHSLRSWWSIAFSTRSSPLTSVQFVLGYVDSEGKVVTKLSKIQKQVPEKLLHHRFYVAVSVRPGHTEREHAC